MLSSTSSIAPWWMIVAAVRTAGRSTTATSEAASAPTPTVTPACTTTASPSSPGAGSYQAMLGPAGVIPASASPAAHRTPARARATAAPSRARDHSCFVSFPSPHARASPPTSGHAAELVTPFSCPAESRYTSRANPSVR